MINLFDFAEDGENRFHEWGRRLSMSDQARLQQKLDRLRQVSLDLATHARLVSGYRGENLFRILIHPPAGPSALMCKGPVGMDREYTLLAGENGRDTGLIRGVRKVAQHRRALVGSSPREYRIRHERIGP
jgi:hypothetical protein